LIILLITYLIIFIILLAISYNKVPIGHTSPKNTLSNSIRIVFIILVTLLCFSFIHYLIVHIQDFQIVDFKYSVFILSIYILLGLFILNSHNVILLDKLIILRRKYIFGDISFQNAFRESRIILVGLSASRYLQTDVNHFIETS